MLLVDYFKQNVGVTFSLSKKAEASMINHNWPANIRELKNVVEYLANLDEKVVQREYFPFIFAHSGRTDRQSVL